MRARIAAGILAAIGRVASGQETPPLAGAVRDAPAFEVASVRPNASAQPLPYSLTWFPDGRFRAVNISLRRLIDVAYDLRSDHQLMDAPGWIASERFDIQAIPTVKADTTPPRLMMLRGLLRDRFALVMRTRPVGIPVYALVRTRPDAPLPRTLRETVPCPTVRWDPFATPRPIPPVTERNCGTRQDRDGTIVGKAATMAGLIAVVRPLVDRRIVDRTGLTGRYDFELARSPDPAPGDTVTAGASIFSTIQDLGLKLEPVIAPADGYVIERIERPTPN